MNQRKSPPTQQQLERAVEQWNAKHPVGTVCRYWRMVREGEPSGSGPVKHPATVLGGHTAVAWIEGCVGCIALTHVEAVS